MRRHTSRMADIKSEIQTTCFDCVAYLNFESGPFVAGLFRMSELITDLSPFLNTQYWLDLFHGKISDWFRVCARCRAPSLHCMAIYCGPCYRQLLEKKIPGLRPVLLDDGVTARLNVRALFLWTRHSDRDLRPLIYALKGGRQRTAFALLAREFSFSLSETHYLANEDTVVVPAPRRSVSKDHAYRWAEALGAIWQWPVRELLDFHDPRRGSLQKQRRRSERYQLEFKLKERFTRKQRIVFVDDVITTGATAQAAYEALGQPAKFETWVLVARPRMNQGG